MSLEERISKLELAFEASQAQNKVLSAENEVLRTALSAAHARIAELEALVLKLSVTKNSQNSSKPPSSDPNRKNQSLRGKSGLPVGGQKGHKGHTLKMTDTPDDTEDLRPNYCGRCGAILNPERLVLDERRQVLDIPLPVIRIKEWRSWGCDCGYCGHHQQGSFPDGVTNHIQYGPNIQSLVVYHSYYQFVPFGRLQDMFDKVFHLSISKGTLENILRRTAQKALPVYEKLQQVVSVSFFVGSDETVFKCKGIKNWFWVWQTAAVTYLVAAVTRAKAVIEQCFPDGLPNTILCSDRLAAQLSTSCKGRQICLAHLLRELNYLIQSEKTPWASDFKTLLSDAIDLKKHKNDTQNYKPDDHDVQKIEQRADKLLHPDQLQTQLADKTACKQTITFFNGMVKLRHALFKCLYHEKVPPDNNASERAFRMVKVKTKISGQFKSLQQEFAIIRSVIDSGVKNGTTPFDTIQLIVNLNTPPKAAG